jgi:hypothetical protein
MRKLVPAVKAQSAQLSFQSSTATAWGQSFLRHFQAELDTLSLPAQQKVVERVAQAAQTLFNQRYLSMPDVTCYTVLGMCSLVLAAYRESAAFLDSADQAFDLVERSFRATYQAFIQNVCKPLVLGSSRSPRSLTKMNFRTWSECMYRPDGVAGRDRRSNATGPGISGYHQFFIEQNEPGLSHIIDAADKAWIETASSYGTPEFVERRKNNAAGSGFTPFQFAPQAKRFVDHKPAIVLKLHVGSHVDQPLSGHSEDTTEADRRRGQRGRTEDRSWSQRKPADRRS